MGLSLSSLLRSLRAAGLDLDAEGAMDAAWLAVRLAERHGQGDRSGTAVRDDRGRDDVDAAAASAQRSESTEPSRQPDPPKRPAEPRPPARMAPAPATTTSLVTPTIRLPVAAALPQSRLLARSLRPLRRRIPSATADLVLDVERTVRRASEEGIWLPAFKPRAERWLDVAIVVDRSLSMMLWTDAVAELRRLLAWSGTFRTISTWFIQTDTIQPLVFRRLRDVAAEAAARKPGTLTPVARRGLVVVVTDCVSPRWYDGSAIDQLREWSRGSLVAITQVLPQPFWPRTALGDASFVRLKTSGEGVTNRQLRWTADFTWISDDDQSLAMGVPQTFMAPVVPLEPAAVLNFARLVAGRATDAVAGAFFDLQQMRTLGQAPVRREMEPKARVARFFSVSSAPARRLAAALAASPIVSLRILRLLRQELVPEGRRSHEAEVLLSGLLRVRSEARAADAEDVPLEFLAGIRALLLDTVTTGDAVRVLRHAAEQAADQLPGAKTFLTALDRPADMAGAFAADNDFLQLASEVLGRVGGAYARVTIRRREPAPSPIDAGNVAQPPEEPLEPRLGPPAPRLFINRVTELTMLRQWWRDPATTTMHVTGPGGIGKTSLVSHFIARLVAEDPPEGGVLVLQDTAALVRQVWEYFAQPPAADSPERLLLAQMSRWPRRRRLLVIDGGHANEPIVSSRFVEFEAHFARSGAGKLLVVSRSQRTLYGAASIHLGPLGDADVVEWLRGQGVSDGVATALAKQAEGRPSDLKRMLEMASESLGLRDPRLRLASILLDQTLSATARVERLEVLRHVESPDDLRAELLTHLAKAYCELDDREQAEAALREAWATMAAIDDPKRGAELCQAFAIVATECGDTWGAAEALRRAAENFERLFLYREAAGALALLARVHIVRQERDQSLETQQRRVELLQRVDGPDRILPLQAAMADLALTYTDAADYPAALEWRLRQVALLEENAAADWDDNISAAMMAEAMLETGRAASRSQRDSEKQRYLQEAFNRYLAMQDWYMADIVQAILTSPAPVDPLYAAFMLLSPSITQGPAMRAAGVRYDDPAETHGPWVRTRGSHTLAVTGEFRVCISPVTKDAYRVFIREGGYKQARYWSPGVDAGTFEREADSTGTPTFADRLDAFPRDQARHPVSGICFEEALAFVRWLNEAMPFDEWQWTLPTEDMWEYAARGDNGFVYPWGNTFRDAACNSRESNIGGTSAVGRFAAGRSWGGAVDLAGNVWEFVAASDQPSHQCVLRGGSFLNTRDEVKSYLRLTGVARDHRPPDFGFRVALVHSGAPASSAAEVRGSNASTSEPRPSPPPQSPDTPQDRPGRGSHAIVALLDDGIDVLHEAFLDGDGRSRIVAIWDQTDAAGSPPAGFSYGTFHAAADIAAYVAQQSVPEALGRNVNGHGSHAASVAAGRLQVGRFHGGLALDASILVVKTAQDRSSISARATDGLAFVDGIATALGRPVVVTASMSLNSGSHDGRSAFELAFDEFTGSGRKPGRVVVLPAGSGRTDRRHAELQARPNEVSRLRWRTQDGSSWARMELWAPPSRGYRFRLKGPSGAETEWVGERQLEVAGALRGDGRYSLQMIPRHVDNGDTLLRVELGDGLRTIGAGDWELAIETADVVDGTIHAWCESAKDHIAFLDYVSENTTIGVPATAVSVIAVGAATNTTPLEAAAFSAMGPTRDRRNKPEVSAPGVEILGARGGTRQESTAVSGTSIAAAHVTGAVALLLDDALTAGRTPPSAAQVRAAIAKTAQHSSGRWDPALGYGLVDVRALLAAFSTA